MSPLLHLVFKTHLDLGFTAHAEAVRRQYHEHFIPMALDTGEHFLMENPAQPKFIWTTGSWLIWDHLETQDKAKVERLERGIAAGIIRWHALPFTTHTELLSPPLFAEGLSISAELDRRFGIKTIAAKMTDVPGHTLGLVPLLAAAGVEFLHIGVNSASTPPAVPPLFRWQAPDGAAVTVAYHTDYGSTLTPDGIAEGLAFAHTNDNLGPQNVGHVVDTFHHYAAIFPGHELRASTLDTFAAALRPLAPQLPVIGDEIADSWIHGVGSAPQRVSRYLAARRAFDRFVAAGPLTGPRRAFGRKLLEVAEHTWGVDIKTYLRDEGAWDRPAFAHARATDKRFAHTERAWAEQDAIVDQALSLLDPRDRVSASLPAPEVPDFAAATLDGGEELALGTFTLRFDPVSGALLGLAAGGRPLLSGDATAGGLFGFSYESYDAGDYDAYMQTYLTQRPAWAVLDHAKPGLEHAKTARSACFTALDAEFGRAPDGAILVSAKMPAAAHEELGAPSHVITRYALLDDGLEITVLLPDKPANRMPEAGFVGFAAAIDPAALRLHKLGLQLSPLAVVEDGNRQLHAVDAISGLSASGVPFRLETRDAPLFAPSAQPFLPFVRTQPELGYAGRFNVFNNKWGTNFSMWSEGTLQCRFVLQLGTA